VDLVYVPLDYITKDRLVERNHFTIGRSIGPLVVWKTPVNWIEFEAIMGYVSMPHLISPREHIALGSPVWNVSWYEAVVFCNKLSDCQGIENAYILSEEKGDLPENSFEAQVEWRVRSRGYRLPNHLEWAYLCRGRDSVENMLQVPFSSKDSRDGESTFGLEHMLRNGKEWVWDLMVNNERIVCAESGSTSYAPDYYANDLGFRVVRSLPPDQ